jgi:tetratricopeptide (TPR) repeat protein
MLVESTAFQTVPSLVDHGAPFVGRDKELNQIRESLDKDRRTCAGGAKKIMGRVFNIDGAAGVGKTTLAIEAARQFSSFFKDGVLGPIRVDEHTPMSFAMHLAGRFDLKVDEPTDVGTARHLVTAMLKDRHVMMILDNALVWKDLEYMLPFETCSYILVTTRSREMHNRIRLRFPGLDVHETTLKKFTPGEVLALFKKMLDTMYCGEEEDTYLEIARNLGYLPIALRQVFSLMAFGPRYTASRLLEKLEKEDRLKILRKSRAAAETDESIIEALFDLSSPLLTQELIETLEYLAVCSPGPVPLDFLQQLSGSEEIDDRLEQLVAFSWCERREVDKYRSYELHQLVRELVQRRSGKGFKEKVIRLVHEIFTDEAVHFRIKERFYFQLEAAFRLAKVDRDKRLIKWMYDLVYFCTYRGYGDFYIRLTEGVEELFTDDKWTLKDVYCLRASVFIGWGKLDEAMKLYKKYGDLCNELGDRAGLALSYAEQALILKAWGKLAEAMTLYKKLEKICEELGDRAELAKCCGNQATIFYLWGKLAEATVLYKKVEEIFTELGDRAGLSKFYGTQALILSDWGKLAEAMALHKKEEKINEELSDRVGLAVGYRNQAFILKAWGKLSEAIALNEKALKIFEELGDMASQAKVLWNQGKIYNKKGDLRKQADLWQKSIQMNKSMGIPTEDYEKEMAALWKSRTLKRKG